MIADGASAFETELIAAAQQCAEEVELPHLARTVGETLFRLPNLCLAGLAVLDEERQAVQRYTASRAHSPGTRSNDRPKPGSSAPARLQT